MGIRFIYHTPLLGIFLLLMSCKPAWLPPDDASVKDALPTRVRGTADPVVMKQIKRLRERGVVVVTMGQDYLVSIPAALLFPTHSPRLMWGSFQTLNMVAAFLKQFRKVAINVTAYGVPYRSAEREISLDRERAAAVANYFWSQGVDTRLLIAAGAGVCPIASCGVRARSFNARIEITFRDAVV